MERKKCSKCKHKKLISEFNKGNSKEGLSCYCKSCNKKNRIDNRPPIVSNLYLITNTAFEGWVKVGRARDVVKRLKSYQTSSPYRDFEIKFSVEVEDIAAIERYIYPKYNFKNEWVEVDYKVLMKDIIDYLNNN